jgi:hypothetical protein
MDKHEDFELSLDPARAAERRSAAVEVVARLRGRGIVVSTTEDSEDLVNLLSAVERFESAVKAHGGDLMVDDLNGSQPDDRHFVVPRRAEAESVREYIGRIDEATANLRHHPRRPAD